MDDRFQSIVFKHTILFKTNLCLLLLLVAVDVELIVVVAKVVAALHFVVDIVCSDSCNLCCCC